MVGFEIFYGNIGRINKNKKGNDMNAIDNAMTDEAIIDLFWKRDERAIALTDAKYRAYLFTIAQNIIYDTYDCDE